MENLGRIKIFVPRDVKQKTRDAIKEELRKLTLRFTSEKRPTRAKMKLWAPSFDANRHSNNLQKNCAPSEQFATISTYVRSISQYCAESSYGGK